jgi:hypothetical protein
MTRIRIDLREISRRMLQKYYPVWLLIIIFSDLAYATMDLNIAIKRGWFKLFVTDGLVSVFIYLTIIGALFFLRGCLKITYFTQFRCCQKNLILKIL